MIFARRWYDIKGETIGAGTPHAMNVIRVRLEKDGPWSSLTGDEVDLLLIQHNQAVDPGRQQVEAPKPAKKKAKAKK